MKLRVLHWSLTLSEEQRGNILEASSLDNEAGFNNLK